MWSCKALIGRGRGVPLTLLLVLMMLLFFSFLPPERPITEQVTSWPPKPSYQKKVILSWNGFFDMADFMTPNLDELNCSETRCHVTSNRALLDVSQALVIHWHDARLDDLPPHKKKYQRWILMTFEPPIYAPPDILQILSLLIDWTATYRLDSDIPSPYGRLEPRMSNSVLPHIANPKELLERLPVAWMNSHCATSGRREELVDELRNYIRIDQYGRCGGSMSLRHVELDEAFRFLAQKYIFYLSFENCICKDYITEKAFQPLHHGLIPVVYGGADYERHLPRGSYVNVKDYPDASHLSQYLHQVMNNWTLYASYFDWKTGFVVSQRACENRFFCGICEKLHKEEEKWKLEDVEHLPNRDLSKWWEEKNDCVHPKNGTLGFSGRALNAVHRKWYRNRSRL